jgi:hypothetical protein
MYASEKIDRLMGMSNATQPLLVAVFLSSLIFFFASCSREKQEVSSPQNSVRFSESVSSASVSGNRFYKGNVHTHTTKSDGDANPSTVTSWYKTHGYDFLFITDHDKLTIYKKNDSNDFITINGVELTGLAESNKIPVHTNALCGTKTLVGIRNLKHKVPKVMQTQVDLAKSNGALAILNHPNFGVETHNAMTTDDVLAVEGFDMLEIASGHPLVHPEGFGAHDSTEKIWDKYLSMKHRVWGVGVDDAHHYSEFGETQANPGRVWIQVWARGLSENSICDAIRNGQFYISNGVQINSISVEGNSFELSMGNWKPKDYVEFIGSKGTILAKVHANPARYVVNGDEGYVRARVSQAKGKKKAWSQPYFIYK